MSEPFTNDDPLTNAEGHPLQELWKSVAAPATLAVYLVAASTKGIRQCFVESTAATHLERTAPNESSTQLREIAPEVRAQLEAVLIAARENIIEDGMRNAVTERLPGLILRHSSTILPALASIIETGRTPPIVAAEVLKELGRPHNAASPSSRLWILERALIAPSSIIRDGAGLGLARLGDPSALPYIRKALEMELDAQTRKDLALVADELSESVTNGSHTAKHQ